MMSLKYNRTYNLQISVGSIGLLVLLLAILIAGFACNSSPNKFSEAATVPNIYPEYYDLALPPNIAPLNFVIEEVGSKYKVVIHGESDRNIEITQRSASISIPIDRWHNLLSENIGDSIFLEVYTYVNKSWTKYKEISHYIATEQIDPWLAYRLVHAVYLKWMKMGIYQRNLSNFDELPIIENSSTGNGCMNCHSFCAKDPSKMMIHFRIFNSGTVLWNEGQLSKVNTKTQKTMSAGIYPAWHPEGKYIAFSTGKLNPHMTTRLNKPVDVADQVSDLVLYNIENNSISTPPVLSTDRRENMPVWSADGSYLYYISAPEAEESNFNTLLHSRYDLMRVSFNPKLNKLGVPELILNADSVGMSMSMPSVSPDGLHMVCAMSDFGYFTIFHKQSDLYCIDLVTQEYRKLELNSENAESYSTWSSNSRWLVFSSKRMDEVMTRPFIAYIDQDGKAHNPFVLPQKDPEMYYRLMANYNRPELIRGQVTLKPSEIKEIVLKNPKEVFSDR
jgi:hypothetical protein